MEINYISICTFIRFKYLQNDEINYKMSFMTASFECNGGLITIIKSDIFCGEKRRETYNYRGGAL